jgi:hypothetical protein
MIEMIVRRLEHFRAHDLQADSLKAREYLPYDTALHGIRFKND